VTAEQRPVPEFALDAQAVEVRPGDRIAYAVRHGDSAALQLGTVLALQWSKTQYGEPELKLKVQAERVKYRDQRPGYLHANLRRFVKI
jgi:hypothetical protein